MRHALAFTTFVILVACGGNGPDADHPNSGAGKTICQDQRTSIDCNSEISYQGVKTEGSLHVLNIGGANGAFASTALRQVNEKVEGYIAGQTRLCQEYNSCVVSPAQYHDEAQKARDALAGIPPLVAALNTDDGRARADAADQIYARVTKKAMGPSLGISFSLDAELPASAGGTQIIVPQNYPLPTNSRIAFKFGVTQPAYVYLFEVDANQEVGVLFPDRRIPTSNPIRPGGEVRIPDGSVRFKIDNAGIGNSNLYLVTSTHALANVEASFGRYQNSGAKKVSEDPLLSDLAGLEPGKKCGRTRKLVLEDSDQAASGSGADCALTRGIVLDAPPAANQPVTKSLEARAAAGDDLIVKVFRYRHVAEADYRNELSTYNASTAAGESARNIAKEN